jgi:hypothetical protein
VTTLRRAALAQVGVVAAVAMGTLAVAAPAYAADDKISVSVLPPGDFNPGDSQTLVVRVDNKGHTNTTVQVSVGGLNNFTVSGASGCDIGGGGSSCAVKFTASDDNKQVNFTLKATGNVDPGQSKTDHGKVQAASIGGASDSADFSATIKGGQQTQAPAVPQVSGTVRDQTTGNPIKGALVVLVDGVNCAPGKEACQTGTDGQGAFRFTSRPDKPITPGSLQVGATKSGFANGVATVDGKAGQPATVTIKLKPSADASASATTDALPTLEAGPATDAPTAAATTGAGAQKKASASGPSTMSWVILVLAGLLVLLGVGVFVVMFLNRKKGDAEDEDGGGGNPPTGPGPGAPPPVGGGVYGTGPGGANATMVAGAGMAQTVMATPGAADATAILRPQRPEDEFPDPYAAPYPTNQAGYPPAGNGYGAGAPGAGGYPPAGYGGGQQQGQGGGYGAAGQPAPGYGAATQVGGYQPEQTQGYGAPPAPYRPGGDYGNGYHDEYGAGGAGYGAAPAGYEQPQGGYEQQGGYGAPAAPAPQQRYDEATRHWDVAGDAGGYPGGPAAAQPPPQQQQGGYPAGYDPRGGGYDPQQGGYDPGYDQPPANGGYDPGSGYDQYHQQPNENQGRRSPSPGRGRDQRLDWLDD